MKEVQTFDLQHQNLESKKQTGHFYFETKHSDFKLPANGNLKKECVEEDTEILSHPNFKNIRNFSTKNNFTKFSTTFFL